MCAVAPMLGWVHVSSRPCAVVGFAGSGGYNAISSSSQFMGDQSVVLLIQ